LLFFFGKLYKKESLLFEGSPILGDRNTLH